MGGTRRGMSDVGARKPLNRSAIQKRGTSDGAHFWVSDEELRQHRDGKPPDFSSTIRFSIGSYNLGTMILLCNNVRHCTCRGVFD
jgi:hypothetical protein